jgi:hypothetical protein
VAALSVIAIAARMEPERCDRIAQSLWSESKKISEAIAVRVAPSADSELWRPGSPRRISGWGGAARGGR